MPMVVVVSQMLVNNGDESHGIESVKNHLKEKNSNHHDLPSLQEFEKSEVRKSLHLKLPRVLLETKPWFSKKKQPYCNRIHWALRKHCFTVDVMKVLKRVAFISFTLHENNIAPENGWFDIMCFLLKNDLFSGANC